MQTPTDSWRGLHRQGVKSEPPVVSLRAFPPCGVQMPKAVFEAIRGTSLIRKPIGHGQVYLTQPLWVENQLVAEETLFFVIAHPSPRISSYRSGIPERRRDPWRQGVSVARKSLFRKASRRVVPDLLHREQRAVARRLRKK